MFLSKYNEKVFKTAYEKRKYADSHHVSFSDYMEIAKLDQTTSFEKPGSYVDWLIRGVNQNPDDIFKDNFKYQFKGSVLAFYSQFNAHWIRELLTIYHNNKYNGSFSPNIYDYNSFWEFSNEVERFKVQNEECSVNAISAQEGMEFLMEQNGWKLLKIKTVEASIYYGKHTGRYDPEAQEFTGRWCVSFDDITVATEHFTRYTLNGEFPIYFLLNSNKKSGGMFAMVPTCNEYRNRVDETISITEIMSISQETTKAMEIVQKDYYRILQQYKTKKWELDNDNRINQISATEQWEGWFIEDYSSFSRAMSLKSLVQGCGLNLDILGEEFGYSNYNYLTDTDKAPLIFLKSKNPENSMSYMISLRLGMMLENISFNSISYSLIKKIVPKNIIDIIESAFVEKLFNGERNKSAFTPDAFIFDLIYNMSSPLMIGSALDLIKKAGMKTTPSFRENDKTEYRSMVSIAVFYNHPAETIRLLVEEGGYLLDMVDAKSSSSYLPSATPLDMAVAKLSIKPEIIKMIYDLGGRPWKGRTSEDSFCLYLMMGLARLITDINPEQKKEIREFFIDFLAILFPLDYNKVQDKILPMFGPETPDYGLEEMKEILYGERKNEKSN